MTASTSEPITYGYWRRARGMGIGQLSPGQTVLLFICLFLPIVTLYLFGPLAALPLIGLSGIAALMLLVRVNGSTAADVLTRAVRFGMAKRHKWAEFSGGVLTDHPRRHDLPGVLAPMVPLSADDGMGGKHGLLWHRRSGYLTVILRVSPLGIELADPKEADQWVANWSTFLADLGYRPTVKHVAVTVDTHPSGGSTSRNYIAGRIDPSAPPAAQSVMRELIDMTPESVADVDTRVSITFDPSAANPQPKTLLDAAAEVTRWIPGIEHLLSLCGVALTGRLTAQEIVAVLRLAYDPGSREEVARALAGPDADELVRWEEAAPIRATEERDYLQHESAYTTAWALSEAPRQSVVSRVLLPLLAPGPYARRMTVLYEPISAEQAPEITEAEVSNMAVRRHWRNRTKRDETQRDRDDEARAIQAAREESAGAGVGRFTFYISTSVPDLDYLPAAVADVEQRAGQSKVRLKRLRRANSAGFAASLGMGINPSTTTPAMYR